jgi:outer membrane protein OmpA-like peptidoglycan-associated protein
MLLSNKIKTFVISFLMIIIALTKVQAQTTQPTWWFGFSGAANLNFYDGTTQRLTNSLIVPTAFHKGTGVKPYGSILVEYRPVKTWGIMLNAAYDARGAKFDNVEAPCNCPATFKTDISYIAIEPSLRLGFNKSSLYFFAGPRIAFNVAKDFNYTQLRQPNTTGELSAMNSTIVSGQIGAGFDIMLSAVNNPSKVTLSPFASFHPYFGQEPRTIESMSLTTVRIGVALKFGKGHKVMAKEQPVAVVVIPVPVHEFALIVHEPKKTLVKLEVSETVPLLSAVFFDAGSASIPARYTLLTKDQANGFKEDQLQNKQSEGMNSRSAGQLTVYRNILNIVGDRMRSNPGSSITLDGASSKGPKEAKEFAESIKYYLVNVFGINGSRISIRGRFMPEPASEHPGGTKDLVMLRAEDRRVDIVTTSHELLSEVGGGMMKSVHMTDTQTDPRDSQVIFSVDSAKQLMKSWSVDVSDEKGTVQHYGPFTDDEAGIQQSSILGTSQEGNYKVTMHGETNNGTLVKKESTLHLAHQGEIIEKGFRYSIVFGFDKSTTIASYNRFLTNVVAPLIADGSTVTIHGHTDIIGGEEYNQKLSESRARETQRIIESALTRAGRTNVKFNTSGYGEDPGHEPFENNLPEERFYNRTVIIDIVPVK